MAVENFGGVGVAGWVFRVLWAVCGACGLCFVVCCSYLFGLRVGGLLL